jgi:hypothetical protein
MDCLGNCERVDSDQAMLAPIVVQILRVSNANHCKVSGPPGTASPAKLIQDTDMEAILTVPQT